MTKFTSTALLLAALLGCSTLDRTEAFSSLPVRQCGLTTNGSPHCSQAQRQQEHSSLSATESSNEDGGTAGSAVMEEDDTTKAPMEQKRNELLYIPKSLDEMVKQVSSAMDDAMKVNKQRQIVRILLPRSADADNLLQYYEASDVDTINQAQDLVLCPTDESWQGGIMQLYRAASYASQAILRYVCFPFLTVFISLPYGDVAAFCYRLMRFSFSSASLTNFVPFCLLIIISLRAARIPRRVKTVVSFRG